MHKVFIFDMDGTLTESKQVMTHKMGRILAKLLFHHHAGVISGASFPQFKKQLLSHLPKKSLRGKLFLLPMNGSELWEHDGKKWVRVYRESLKRADRAKIRRAFSEVFKKNPHATKTWGSVLDDRGSQITFSGLGNRAPLGAKAEWDPTRGKRKKMRTMLKNLLPDFEITIGGTTSIDVTRKGITKAFGIRRALEIYGFKKQDAVFVGDALFPGGNDYAAKKVGIRTVEVSGPRETEKFIERQVRT